MSDQTGSALAAHVPVASGERLLRTEMGVVLRVRLGSTLGRVLAFGIDFGVILLAMGALGLLGACGLSVFGDVMSPLEPWAEAAWTMAFFVSRFAYFVWFETKKQGQTLGKKVMKLQVIDAQGGKLGGRAILMRNFSREFELVTPVILGVILLQLHELAHWSLVLLSCLWVCLIATLPLWNRRRARLGDLLAGTQVIEVPQAELLEDIDFMLPDHLHYTFSPEQLDMYGTYELGVLEEILRTTTHPATLGSVCARVTHKIGWTPGALRPWQEQPRKFLQDFYVALRMRREQQQLYGNHQDMKKEGVLSGVPMAQKQ